MYCIKPFLYDIVNVSLRFSQYYFTNCIGAVMESNQMGTNTVRIVTNTLLKSIIDLIIKKIDNIVKKWSNVIGCDTVIKDFYSTYILLLHQEIKYKIPDASSVLNAHHSLDYYYLNYSLKLKSKRIKFSSTVQYTI